MIRMKSRNYSESEKFAAVERFLVGGESVATIAADTGISRSTLYAWIKSAQIQPGMLEFTRKNFRMLEAKVKRLEGIVEIARQHHLIIFSDEIYDRLVMDGLEHVSIASLAPDLFCVTFSGLSKSHMIAGFRIGWMILSGNKAIAKDYIEGLKMLSNMRLCSNVPAQSVVQTALGGHQSVNDYIVPGGRIYEQREYVYKAFCDIPGITAVKPKAAFYMFPKIDTKKFNITNDEKFALDLLRDKKLLIVHGGGFNWGQPDHFRVVYLPRIEVLKDAVGKLTDFLSYYHQ